MLNSRDIAVFKRGLVQTVGCAIAGAAFRLTYSYLQARLTWKWRNKLTRVCHEKYFRDMNWLTGGAACLQTRRPMSAASLASPSRSGWR